MLPYTCKKELKTNFPKNTKPFQAGKYYGFDTDALYEKMYQHIVCLSSELIDDKHLIYDRMDFVQNNWTSFPSKGIAYGLPILLIVVTLYHTWWGFVFKPTYNSWTYLSHRFLPSKLEVSFSTLLFSISHKKTWKYIYLYVSLFLEYCGNLILCYVQVRWKCVQEFKIILPRMPCVMKLNILLQFCSDS